MKSIIFHFHSEFKKKEIKQELFDKNVYSELQNDCGKIRRVLISSINTTKEKYNL